MNISGAIVAYFIIWWTVLFAVLPMRVKGQWEDGADGVTKGTEAGAPTDPQLWFKAKRTTWIAAIVWAVVFAVVQSGLINYGR